MLTYIVFNIFLVNSIYAKDVGEACPSKDDIVDGVCELLNNCSAAVRYIQKNGQHPFTRCGFERFTEIVCCPLNFNDISITTETTSTSHSGVMTREKFGETQTKPLRIADKECQNILNTTQPPLNLYIIGGEEVSPGEFPHMVALGYERTDGYEFLCGGSLISKSYVLTAAHCTDTLDQVKPSIVRMGIIDLGGPSFSQNDVRIVKIIQHPSYARSTKYHDLALLELEVPVKFSMGVKPICLYTKDDYPKDLVVTGWGKTSIIRDIKSTSLLKAKVLVVTGKKCSQSYTNWRKLPVGIIEEQICAGDPQGLHDTCQGDSGGPLQIQPDDYYRLVGVTSFGRGCGTPVPGVYTRVSRYLDWVESVVWPTRA